MTDYLGGFVTELNRRYNKDSAEMTHGEWMCKNTTLNKKPFSFSRYPFQIQIANDMHDNLDCMKPSQVGLALALDTPILTGKGWSTMGQLKIGDPLFDEQGQPCQVTYISPVYKDHVCYALEFDTGEVIIADANHRWYVEGDKVINTTKIFELITLDKQEVAIPLSVQWQALTLKLGRPEEALRRRIVSVKPVDTVDVRCITVDSPSHLFLAGRGLIPTHNTEIQIRKALSILKRMDNRSLIYTMPNDKMFKRVSKTRIQTIVDTDRAFKSDTGKNSMGLIQLGSSFLYVTGSTEGDATSINADIIFNDEVDLTDQTMLALFNSRLQGSDLRIRQRFSTPTYAGYGIHKGYSASDQHEFMIKCRGCNHWQIPLFNKKFIQIPGICDKVEKLTDLEVKLLDDGLIKLDDIKIHCEKCRRPLNMADYERRQWVPRFANRAHHRGYHVRPFSTHTLDPKYIITQLFDYKRRNNMKGFFNTVLGETYDQGNSRLSAQQIEAVMKGASEPVLGGSDPVFIGIDVGLTCHIVLGTGSSPAHMKPFYFRAVPEGQLFGVVEGLMKKYQIVAGGMDKYPYTPTANAMRDVTHGIIMPVEYGKGREFTPIKNEFDQQIGVRASRTMLLDYVAEGIRNETWEFYGYGDDKNTIVTQLQDMVREEGTGEEEAQWVKLNGNDHFFHALAFMMAGMRNYEFQNHTEEYRNTDDDIFGAEFDVRGGSIWGNPNLIGFESLKKSRTAFSDNTLSGGSDHPFLNPFANM